MPDQAASVIESIAAHTLQYAVLLAAIGTLSMALIELLKGVFALRRHFHHYQFNHWIHDEETRRELLVLATGGEKYADVMFEQPTERMMGQIQAAANLSLEYPDRYNGVYRFFSSPDLALPTAADEISDSKLWAEFATRTAKEGVPAEIRPQQETEARAAQQARVRLGNLIARRLDTFQNRTQYLWSRYNQAASIIVGAGFTMYALASSKSVESKTDLVALILYSLAAGMLAPFAKDVVSAISGLRAKA